MSRVLATAEVQVTLKVVLGEDRFSDGQSVDQLFKQAQAEALGELKKAIAQLAPIWELTGRPKVTAVLVEEP